MKPKHEPGPPMMLGNMCELSVQQIRQPLCGAHRGIVNLCSRPGGALPGAHFKLFR